MRLFFETSTSCIHYNLTLLSKLINMLLHQIYQFERETGGPSRDQSFTLIEASRFELIWEVLLR